MKKRKAIKMIGVFMTAIMVMTSMMALPAFAKTENIKVLEHNDVSWILPSEVDQYEFCPADTVILKKIKEIYVRRNEQ